MPRFMGWLVPTSAVVHLSLPEVFALQGSHTERHSTLRMALTTRATSLPRELYREVSGSVCTMGRLPRIGRLSALKADLRYLGSWRIEWS